MIDGRALAEGVKRQLSGRVEELASSGIPVRLDVLLAEGNSAGEVYSRNQERMCADIGIEYVVHPVSANATQQDVEDRISELNADAAVTAVMVHLPLPDLIDTERIQGMIALDKDVEGVNPGNIGGVIYGRRTMVPCTALAIMRLIESTGVELEGTDVVCVGANRIVGRPVAVLLMSKQATVTSTNVHTSDLASHTRRGEILVVAAGVPGLITAEMVKPGAVVIDVGINRVQDAETGVQRTMGDVDFDSVSRVAGWLSPVPGGVGPMTVAMLLRNTVAAADPDV